jgi:hypothetical protein
MGEARVFPEHVQLPDIHEILDISAGGFIVIGAIIGFPAIGFALLLAG